MTFAERLKAMRTAAEWTQSELAERSGVDRGQVAHYEQAHSEPSLANLIKLADALRCTLDELAGRKPPKPRKASSPGSDQARTPVDVDATLAAAKAAGRTYQEIEGKAYRLRQHGWECV